MNSQEDIVITGLGLVSSLGLSPDATWSAIIEGRSGIGPMSALEQLPVVDKGGAQAPDLPENYHASWPRVSRYLRFVIEQALEDALCDNRALRGRIGTVLGTTLHGMRAGGEFLRADDPRRLSSFLAGTVLEQTLDGLAFAGPRLSTCSACSSGLGAIVLGATLLRTRQVDLAICGGYDPVSEYSYAGFDSLRLMAAGPDGPRPFSADRDGMKVGEGYGIVILEHADDAMARGSHIRAVLAGCGETSDSFHLTQPDPAGTGAAQAACIALREGGLHPENVDMISAHATATPNNDAAEYGALLAAFGPALAKTPVVAFKSYVGHTLGGAGAVELLLSILACETGCVPPTANTRQADSQFVGLKLVHERPLPANIRSTMNLSLGFGGANTCIVLTKPSARRLGAEVGNRRHENQPVITGIGLVLPGIVSLAALRESVAKSEDELSIAGGAIPDSEYAHLLVARRTRRMSEYVKLTLAAANAACEDSDVREDREFLAGCSAILGTTHGSSPFCEAYYGEIVRNGLAAANPVLFAEGVPNAAAAHLSMALGIKGGCQTIIGSRCAGLEALMLASLRIREGRWSRAIVSAGEEFSQVVIDAYRSCGLDGLDDARATGSGALCFILESKIAAIARGARIRGWLGQCDWRTLPRRQSVCEVVAALGTPSHVVCALGELPPDKAALASLGARCAGVNVWSSANQMPELWSVGPLAATAATLMKPDGARPALFGVLGTEFSGASCGLLVESPERR